MDCLDPDCCLQSACQNSLLCRGSRDPLDIIQQGQTDSPAVKSFYDRIKLLAGKDSTHIIPGDNPFNSRWAPFCPYRLPAWPVSFLAEQEGVLLVFLWAQLASKLRHEGSSSLWFTEGHFPLCGIWPPSTQNLLETSFDCLILRSLL